MAADRLTKILKTQYPDVEFYLVTSFVDMDLLLFKHRRSGIRLKQDDVEKFAKAFSSQSYSSMKHVGPRRRAAIPRIRLILQKNTQDINCRRILLGCFTKNLDKVLEESPGKWYETTLFTLVRASEGPLKDLGPFNDSPTEEFPTIFRHILLSNGQYTFNPSEE